MHYKSLFDYKHLGCQDLPRKDGVIMDISVTMTSLEKREVVTEGGRKEMLPVAVLQGAPKPMIMNKTNLKTLSELFNTTEYEEFVGKTFIIGKSIVKGKAGGLVEGLRIRNVPAVKAPLPELTEDHRHYAAILQAVRAENTTIEQLKAKYVLTEEIILKLTNNED